MTEFLQLDAVSDEDIKKLIGYGETLVKDKKDLINKAIRSVVD